MPSFRITAFILRQYNFSEADRILVIFSREQGKLKGIAKGVRKTRSRLAGSVGLLNCSELQAYGKNHQDLFLVTQGQLRFAYPLVKSDLNLLGRAARFYELIDRLTPEHQPLPEVFDLLGNAMQILESGFSPAVVGTWFEMNLLDQMGYGPILDLCMSCGADKAQMAYVPERGGVVCRDCSDVSSLPLSPGARALLKKIRTITPDAVRRLQIENSMEKEIANFLTAAFQYQIGRTLNSDKFRAAVSRTDSFPKA